MKGEVLLSSKGRVKLLEFMIKAAIGNDHDHSNFCLVIDVNKQVVRISNHVNVNSGITASYEWPIQYHTGLTDTVTYELPAKGLVNILNKFSMDKPVWLVIESDRSLALAEYVDEKSPQPSLFDLDEWEVVPNRIRGIKYRVQAKSQFTPNHYHLPDNAVDVSFQISSGALSSELRLIYKLSQERGSLDMGSAVLFHVDNDANNNRILMLYAEKQSWANALSLSIDNFTSNSFDSLPLVGVNKDCISSIAGLLSKVSGSVYVDITPCHLVFRGAYWQCGFRLTSKIWKGKSKMRPWIDMPSTQYIDLDSSFLDDLLPKLDVADDEKRARLVISSGSKDKLFHLGVAQDHVSAETDINLDAKILPEATSVSLSLWSLKTVLEHLGSQIYWLYYPKRNGVLITNHQRKEHVLLAGQQNRNPVNSYRR